MSDASVEHCEICEKVQYDCACKEISEITEEESSENYIEGEFD